MTDHMLVMNFDAESGWSAPIIQPYQPLQLDPASSCFQYCTNVFEGMKVREELRCDEEVLPTGRSASNFDKLVVNLALRSLIHALQNVSQWLSKSLANLPD